MAGDGENRVARIAWRNTIGKSNLLFDLLLKLTSLHRLLILPYFISRQVDTLRCLPMSIFALHRYIFFGNGYFARDTGQHLEQNMEGPDSQ
jgi:hypothetical protein